MPSTLVPITLARQVSQSDEVLLQELSGEAVLLDLASESYFGLNPVGTRIWTLIGEGNGLQAVRDVLCAEYDAEPAKIESDLLALVTALLEAGLVKVD